MQKTITNTRRARLLEVVQKYIQEHGHSPAVSDLQELTISSEVPNGFSYGSIQWHLEKLVQEGYITRHKGLGRTIRLV